MGEKASDSCSMCTVPLVSGDQMNDVCLVIHLLLLLLQNFTIAQLHIAHVPSTNDRVHPTSTCTPGVVKQKRIYLFV
jgi:hypothetical protein